ncbi:hypothetical protein BLAT2472_90131 [Burkholderia latens]
MCLIIRSSCRPHKKICITKSYTTMRDCRRIAGLGNFSFKIIKFRHIGDERTPPHLEQNP